MTIKDAVANSLLMFVAASCVVLIVRAIPQSTPRVEAGTSTPVAGVAPVAATAPVELRNGVKVYYFHGNFRCETCRTIEAYAREAVETGFGDELKSGKIQWQVVNYESPGNEHFATEYQVAAPLVVLVKMENSKQVDSRSLPEVWEHYRDKTAFVGFVQTNLRQFLAGMPATPSSKSDSVLAPEPTPAALPIPE